MSYHEPFYVFPRKLKSGRVIFYYQTYLPNGKLSNARSTGQTKAGAAKAYCRKLFKEDRLIPDSSKIYLFGHYFKDWWEWGPDPDTPSICPYLTRKSFRGQKPSYAQAHISRLKFKRHILPYFEKMAIRKISTRDIEVWLDGLTEKKLSGKTQKDILSLLRVMLKEARRLGDIDHNPVLDVIPPLKSKARKRGILTTEETQKLFDLTKIDSIWDCDFQAMGAFLLARDTAMRPGEIRAIQLRHVHSLTENTCTVDIVQAVDHLSHRIKETKTAAIIEGVPVRKDTALILKRIIALFDDPEDLLFSKDGTTHVSENYLKRRLYKALHAIGISDDQRKERNITPYSFRNMAITRLRQQGVSDLAVKSPARHQAQVMTDGYTNFSDPEIIDQLSIFYMNDNNNWAEDAV
jgi:integrase